ncbi:T9SS type A sorting domain-containing protein [Pseudoflavitalea sp. G-6-1-2]|uniref:T9SS type A sorting domain-containing protein n=1 Tax=Pseudoflavitalea sp. G-6-1-2 TaxID=2728841 RepID=UPI00146A5DD4|nr:T9SS type A sorting domain-containing protein [Pseudoflavitalea sp. G-6-1-2]NML20148.1 T9SS type A sorting domain-containing protein [Pseudoflavitalea sp. G-6-1-2]
MSIPAGAVRAMLLCSLLFFSVIDSMAQCVQKMQPETIPKGTIPGNAIPGNSNNDFIRGHLKYFPSGYDPAASKKYPVIIFIPGYGAQGNGSASDLCKIISDMDYGIPWNIEHNRFPETVTHNGVNYKFIVLSPQYDSYNAPWHYSTQLDAYITWILSQYKIDPDRVYLTGASAGASIVMDYVSSSIAHGRRIAAASFGSVCFDYQTYQPNGPAVVAAAGVPTWFVHCTTDGSCGVSIADNWVSQINSYAGAVAPRYSRLEPKPWGVPDSDSLLYCRGWQHMTWPSLYSPLTTSNALDPNFFHWNLQHSRAASLPVLLKDFTAKLSDGKVKLHWVTTTEINNQQFVIERAGADQRFSRLSAVAGKGNSSTEQVYEFVDNKPLGRISYYRLVQIDYDGNQQQYDAKRILNNGGEKSQVAVSSNPFTTELSAFVTVHKPQQVMFSVVDMNGKQWARITERISVGTAEIRLPVSNLPRGVYLLKASGDGISAVVKVIKN